MIEKVNQRKGMKLFAENVKIGTSLINAKSTFSTDKWKKDFNFS